MTLGPNALPGTYVIDGVTAVDRAGNWISDRSGALATFTIAPAGAPDLQAPTLASLAMTVDSSGGEIHVDMQVADDLSDVAQVAVMLQQDGADKTFGERPIGADFVVEAVAAYDPATAMYRATFPVPPMAGDSYRVSSVSVVDHASNFASANLARPTALGFDISTLHVQVAGTCN